jgi:hypothetical protein
MVTWRVHLQIRTNLEFCDHVDKNLCQHDFYFYKLKGNKDSYKRKKLLLLATCFISSVASILLLYILSGQVNNRKNGFIRLYPPHVITPLKIIDLSESNYYFAGKGESKIFLAKINDPSSIFTVDYNLTDTHTYSIKLPVKPRLIQANISVSVIPPHFFITQGSAHLIMRGNLSDYTINHIDSSFSFDQAIPVSLNSLIIRTYDRQRKQNILGKIYMDPPKFIRSVNNLIKQQDGIFSTDGMINYDDNTRSIIYIYFYRNSILSLDSSLNLIATYKTIDTTSQAKIGLAYLSDSSLTMNKPPHFVNKQCYTANGLIFVHSVLKANNEETEIFDKSTTIDVYNVKTGLYKLSFYIPKYLGMKITSFIVADTNIFVLYDHFLFSYHLNKIPGLPY